MALEPLDIVNGIFGSIFVIISIILGLKIILKYRNTKDINLLLVGLFIMLLSCGWYGTTISFIVALVTGGDGISFEMIVLLNFTPLSFAFLFWMTAFSNFLYKEKQKIILICCSLYCIVFFTIFLYFIFTNPVVIGEKISPVDTKANSLLLALVLVVFIVVILVTGVKFAIETIKLEGSEMKLKGKLLLVAFPSFIIGGLLDATMATTAITLIIFRLILISSALEFYCAFIMPKWMKKRLKSVKNN